MINNPHLAYLPGISAADVEGLTKADARYGDSWKSRGGPGAYIVTMRKVDRLEVAVKEMGYDIFAAAKKYPGKEGILDTIRDLRRYLMLWEAEILMQAGELPNPDFHHLTTPEVWKNLVERMPGLKEFLEKKGHSIHQDKTGQRHPFGYKNTDYDDAGKS